MRLYCISIFLDDQILNKIAGPLESLGLSSRFRLETVVDQTGTTARTLMGSVGQVSMIFLPANDFHRHRDFEMGLTELTSVEWDAQIRRLTENGVVSESGPMPDDLSTSYAIFGDAAMHSPFFGLFDGRSSILGSNDVVSFQLSAREYDFYVRSIAPRLDDGLRRQLTATRTVEERPTILEIRIHDAPLQDGVLSRSGTFHGVFLPDRIRIGDKDICLERRQKPEPF